MDRDNDVVLFRRLREMVRLAAENQWWDLWSGLVRVCSNPKELIGLVGRVLHRHPSLRTEREQPVVYQGAARR